MNKADLVSRVAAGTGLTQVEVAAVVEGVLEGISTELVNGGHVEIRGFGTFKVEQRAERDAINPQTGQRIRVPAKLAPVFRPSEKLKARLNK
ncbi:HU family DNA-binding protein [bacterium]|nr:HU family DNA-binding protein [bacterium]